MPSTIAIASTTGGAGEPGAVAADLAEVLATLRDAEQALQHSAPEMGHYPEPQSRHFSALLRVRRAIAALARAAAEVQS